MDAKGGEESVRNMRAAGNVQGECVVVSNAGHHMYLDNPVETNRVLVEVLDRSIPPVA